MDALLREALDDFDEVTAEFAGGDAPHTIPSVSTHEEIAPTPLSPVSDAMALGVGGADNLCGEGRGAPAQVAAGRSAADGGAQNGGLCPDKDSDELVQLLMQGLQMEGLSLSKESDGSGCSRDTGACDASVVAQDTKASGSKGDTAHAGMDPETNDLEETLRKLEKNAQGLVQDEPESVGGEDAALINMLQRLAGSLDSSAEGSPEADSEAEAGLMSLLNQLSDGISGDATAGTSQTGGDDGISKLLSGLSGDVAAGDAPAEAAMDGMFGKLATELRGALLSKELMLEPMQHLQAEIPRHLAARGDSLPQDEVARFKRQHEIVSEILEIYASRPDDTEAVTSLMEQLQQCGPPPTEVAGLNLDAAGGCTLS